MKARGVHKDKELYQELRRLSCRQLWESEVQRFEHAPAEERPEKAAVVRAVGTVFSESGSDQEKEQARQWLRRLWRDPCEKIRRYAIAALPKVGAESQDEAALLSLVESTTSESERRVLVQALEKIGGAATLQRLGQHDFRGVLRAEQKVRASVARSQTRSVIKMDQVLPVMPGFRIHLHSRRGLEGIVRKEVEEHGRRAGLFRCVESRPGLVALVPLAPFTLKDLYTLRCFGAGGFVLGTTSASGDGENMNVLVRIITSPLTRNLLRRLTLGPIRYRLEFVSRGHQRGMVHLLAERIYSEWAEMLNDPKGSPWAVRIEPAGQRSIIELSPRFSPDPRFLYRQMDIPAASHPPLAACMARLAGSNKDEIVWDPFCGSGLELVERALLGGVKRMYGTDRSAKAIAIARANFAAARLDAVEAKFICADFREFAQREALRSGAVSLVITNPPLGRRVPVGSLDRLIDDLFEVAAMVLRPGGRLVLVNPLRQQSANSVLRLQFRQIIDLGGFNCRLELYRKPILRNQIPNADSRKGR